MDGRGVAPPVNAGLPRRHQRSRRKGARTPEGVIYCGRPTIRGNPFHSKRVGGHARSVGLYKAWLERRLGALTLGRLGYCPNEIDALFRLRHRLEAELPRLVGADLQCWCPLTSRWCHVDVLIAHVRRIYGARPRPELVEGLAA
ncbi:DUF4326 domain-containing protein [Sphingopyxis terrae]|uniref:DUF4326 domain-containing protein n=1 Tax=Sphingopyxis terrae TaxID=33052 RepID=UPI003F80C0DE